MTNARLFFVGGLLAYRGLFNWLTPTIYIPSLVVGPIFQILFFAYLGRTARLEDDSFYVMGNAVQLAALPCLFALSSAINGERYAQTLSSLIASPANRAALFLGRALPVMANGFLVSVISFVAGALLLDVRPPASAIGPLAVVVLAASFSCTGIGLVAASVGLRVRENAVLSNFVFALLLIFCGVNVPVDALPGWMGAVANGLPLTRGIEAARRVFEGAGLGDVAGLLSAELAIGAAYFVAGMALLGFFEWQSRRHASLEVS